MQTPCDKIRLQYRSYAHGSGRILFSHRPCPISRFSTPVQTGPGAHPASCIMGTESCPGVRAAGAWSWPLTPLLVPLVMKEYSYTCTPLWAVRPVQSLSACTCPVCPHSGFHSHSYRMTTQGPTFPQSQVDQHLTLVSRLGTRGFVSAVIQITWCGGYSQGRL